MALAAGVGGSDDRPTIGTASEEEPHAPLQGHPIPGWSQPTMEDYCCLVGRGWGRIQEIPVLSFNIQIAKFKQVKVHVCGQAPASRWS